LVRAGGQPKLANAVTETNAEAKARAAYDAAEKAAREAEAALIPLRSAMQKADAEYAKVSRAANTKRQQATDAKNMAGEAGAKELKQAEANVPVAIKELTEATNAKPILEKALADAQAAVVPLHQAYDVAEKTAKEAETVAKAAATAASKVDDDAKKAAAQAAILRRAAIEARMSLPRLRQSEQNLQSEANTAAKTLTDAADVVKAADAVLANAKNRVAATVKALAAAEKAAQDAAAKAKQVAGDARKPAAEKKKTAEEAASKRKAAAAAKEAVAPAQAAQKNAQNQYNTAAKNLALATAQKKAADEAMANARNQIAEATTALPTAEKAAEDFAKLAEAMNLAAAKEAAKRKAIAEAEATLEQAQQAEQQAQTQVNAASKVLAGVVAKKKPADDALAKVKNRVAEATTALAAAEKAAQEAAARAKKISADPARPDAEKKKASAEASSRRKAADAAKAALTQMEQNERAAAAPARAAAQRLADAEAQKKAADQVLANARNQVKAAMAPLQAAQEAARDFLQLDAASKQASTEAAAKRREASAAMAVLAPALRKLEQATLQVNSGEQRLAVGEARKKSAEQTLDNLTKRIAAAKQSYLTDEEAAKAAEAVVPPLKEEADKSRAAFTAALKIAEERRALADQAKAALYRVGAAGQVVSLMDSPDPPKPANRIDEIVFAKLKTLGIKPVLCSDAVFVRRAYLDLTGKLPSAEEARAFIQSTDKNKRVALIGLLLDRSAHVDYWAMRWSDVLRIKAEFPVKVWPNAAQAYHRWVWESIAQNKRYDKFARELLTSSGSNFRVGPVNFYRAIQDRTPEGIAGAVGLALMGTRVQFWPPDRRAAMAVFFTQVGYKPTSEWKEEIVFWDPLNSVALPGSIAAGIDSIPKSVTATNQIPQALDKPLSGNEPLAAVFPDGTKTTIPPDRDPREVFADWLIRPENPWLAKNIANRTWSWAIGRGIIHEPDDIRQDNPPGNPELLAYLEKEVVSSGYDLKHLKRLIFTSTTYQFSSIPRYKGPEATTNFASYLLRRVEAEVLIDVLNEISGSSDLYTSAVPEPFTYIPKDMPAVALPDGSITSSFLTLFGRSARSTGMEGERVNELASPQWLHMLNSADLQSKLQNGPKIRALLSAGGKESEIVERLYLTLLSRFPTDADMKAAELHAKSGAARGREMWIDLTWALINSPEFLLRH
jgi:hypothetical protein